MRFVTGVRLAALLVLVAGLAVLGAGRAAAQTTTFTGTVHAMECYHGVGADIFEECHTEVATSSQIVEVEGNVVTFVIPEEELVGYLGAYIYCSDQVDGEVLYDGSYADGATFSVEDGDEILCDVYFIAPAPDGGSTDDGSTGGTTTTATSTGGTTLPATGTGPAAAGSSMMLLAVLALGIAGAGFALRRAPR